MTDDEMQTPEEIAVQQELNDFAMAWLVTILQERRFDLAMAVATPELRLARAQAWILNAEQTGELDGLDREEAARVLTSIDVTHPLWQRYAAAEVEGFAEALGDMLDHMAAGSRPRAFDPTHELVIVADLRTVRADVPMPGGGPGKFITGPQQVRAVPIIIRNDENGMAIASHQNAALPVPGWPPTL